MIFYIPSLFILLLSAVFIFAFVPNVTPVLLAIIAIASLLFAVYHHHNLFFNEYKNMNWTNTAGMAAPYIVVGTIILLSIGYILLLVTSGKAPSLPTFSTSIPPPSTATNSLTRAIGNGLVATKAANVAPSMNTAQRNLLESGLSKAV
jgi:hypothetical protein